MKHRMHGRPIPDPDEIPEGIDLDDSERLLDDMIERFLDDMIERFLDDMIEDGRMMSE